MSVSRDEIRERKLAKCEAAMEKSYSEVCHALAAIHDDKLYVVAGYDNFKDYCENRWGYSKSRAHQLIDHAKIVDHLKSQGVEVLPSAEGHTRPLMKLRRKSKSDEDFLNKADEAWRISVDTAPKKLDVPQVSQQHVESTLGQYGLANIPKKKLKPPEVEQLCDGIDRLAMSRALRLSPEEFIAKFGAESLPKRLNVVVDWLMGVAELA